MMEEKPSKYHQSCFNGNKETNGYGWSWNSRHEDLTPTETVNIECQNYCVYCGHTAYPIQAGLRGYGTPRDRDYDITGYCCICESAEKEKELKQKQKELRKKHKEEEYELRKEYQDFLKHDKIKLLTIEYEAKLKSLKWHESIGV